MTSIDQHRPVPATGGELPTFADFYRAVHHRDPFPWQERLAASVADAGWPREVGVATGLGKTTTIDVAVWSLAAQATLPPGQRTAPTRIWYVVDRRLLVDAASDHADRLGRLLATASANGQDDPVGQVARRLERLAGVPGRAPLWVSRLRGGARPGQRPPDPSQPAVLCATVAMYGSRLLFRGFGSSNRMWPIDAALAGTDALVLLDEAHLALPLQQLLDAIPACDANHTGILRAPGRFTPPAGAARLLPEPRSYPRLVSLTATGHHPDRFDLDDEDRRHPVVAARLAAAKPTRLVETTIKDLPSALAGEALEAAGQLAEPGAAVVFVNRPATARAVAAKLKAKRAAIDLVVLTGQLRDADAEQVRRRLLDPEHGCPAEAGSAQRARPLIVVATQTLEVGADLDFDVCVSQTAGVRAITQRWGRLNRLGGKPHARGVLCHPADADPDADPLYGDQPVRLWQRLTEQATNGLVGLGPDRITKTLGAPDDAPGLQPQLLPTHLWEFAKTTSPAADAAPPEVFFAGVEEELRLVSLAWRAELPQADEPPFPAVHPRETVEVTLVDVRAFLANDRVRCCRLSIDGAATEPVTPGSLQPGDRLVVDAASGGYQDAGWDPDATDVVPDLSPYLRGVLNLTTTAWENFAGRPPDQTEADLIAALAPSGLDEPDPDQDRAAADRLAARAAAVDGTFANRRATVERLGARQHPVLVWDAPTRTEQAARQVRVDALEQLSIAPAAATLAEHHAAVGACARQLAAAVGIAPLLPDALEAAGRYHDLGKADRRFQRWLGADPDGPPRAKSAIPLSRWEAARIAAGWPRGGSHELLGVQLLDAAIQAGVAIPEPDLVRHLVATHHGRGRPLGDTSIDGISVPTTVQVDGRLVVATTDPSEADWQQPERFRRVCERYGYWGAALLEALVRQADHTVSAATEIQ
jgi:CRISPR-associated endonuclease/helicase Cas3